MTSSIPLKVVAGADVDYTTSPFTLNLNYMLANPAYNSFNPSQTQFQCLFDRDNPTNSGANTFQTIREAIEFYSAAGRAGVIAGAQSTDPNVVDDGLVYITDRSHNVTEVGLLPDLSSDVKTMLSAVSFSAMRSALSMTASDVTGFNTAADARITAQKGAVSGICPLNGSQLIDSTYLPSYVDDVLEYADLASFPGTGVTGKIYVSLATNLVYRWSGSTYVEISPSTQLQADWNQSNTSALDYIKNKPSLARTTSSLSLSFVGTGATGTQISATKDSKAKVNITLSATASISGGATSNVTVKKCATNSATESDWTTALPTIAEIGQSYSLAIALQGIQTDKRQLEIEVPAGWYIKAQNSGTGTHSESITGAEKTIFG